MDLQMNISTVTQTTKKKAQKANKADSFSNKKNSQISFVSKPSFEGKTIARKRKHEPNAPQKVNFSLLNTIQNDSTQFKQSIQSPVKEKRKDKIKDVEKTVDFPDTTDASFSINTVNDKKPKKHEKQNHSKDEKREGKEKKQWRNETDNQETKKKSVYAQIHGLFKNNPEIPKIGQRLVKPINEKVFSGKNFENLNIHSFSIANLEKNMGLKQLTVVQQKASPVILEGRDVLVRSQTGSGKTLAYALPIVEALQALRPKLKRHDGVKALVIVPTRELALQTYELFNKLVRPFTWIVPGYLIGGENRKAEKARIRKGFNILIGTPGRLCDHIKHTVSLKLDGTRCLILDEADRLLDMGYEKDVASIVQTLASHKAASGYDPMALVRDAVKKSHIHFGEVNGGTQDADGHIEEMTKDFDEKVEKDKPNDEPYGHELSNVFLSDKRQTVLLSATLTKAVETLAGLTMENPVFIDASEGRATLIADSLAKPTELKEEIKNENESESNEDTQDGDFEIVPLADSDEDNNVGDKETNDETDNDEDNNDDECKSEEESDGDNTDESDNDDQSDESSGDSESEDKKAIDKSKLSAYKGVNAFTGFRTEKEELKKSKKKNKKLSKKKIKEAQQQGDSSDEESDEKIKENIKSRITATVQETTSKKSNKQGSDSDSDYDFFAVAKCPKNKVSIDIPDEEPDFSMETNFVTESGDHNNPFQNAVQSAIAQDEMIIPSSVTQIYIIAPMKLRLVTLSALIIERCVKPGNGKMLVFMGTQDLIDYHCDILSRILAGKTPRKIEPDLKAKNKRDEKKNKKNKFKDGDEFETADNDEEVDLDADVEDEVEKKKNKKIKKEEVLRLEGDKMGGNDDEEYNQYEYDGMDLEEYEAKIRAEKAFVNVEFFQLHGSMDQKTRTEVFKTFRKASSGVLLCTDVAARGLDLPHVDCIVQYTGPISATDYVHRVGRTARAGNVGTAIMMLLPSEVLFVRQLEERRIRLHQEDMEEALKALAPLEQGPHRGGGPLPTQAAAASLQEAFEELVLKDKELYVKGCKAFTSWLRFYSTYPREARAAFDRNALHVGHAARALALRDPPKKIAKAAPRPTNRKESDLKRKAEKTKKSPGAGVRAPSAKSASREKRMLIGEFQSGIEPPKKKAKANKKL